LEEVRDGELGRCFFYLVGGAWVCCDVAFV
jgi:hypothetical protein